MEKKTCKALNYLIFRIFDNSIEYIKKNKGLKLADYFLLGILLTTTILYTKMSYLILLIPILYIFTKTFPITLKQIFYRIRFIKLPIDKSYVLNHDRRKKNIQIYSYSHNLHNFLKNKDVLQEYFNINIIDIQQNRKNRKKILITYNKNKTDKLQNVLSSLGYLSTLINRFESDFYTRYDLKINENTKNILNLKNELSFRLKKRVSIELENGLFIFKVHKNNKIVYTFNKLIHTAKHEHKKIPVLIGINKESGELIIGDLTIMLNTFINGIVGSGKSCLFHGMIQSLLLWNKNIQMVLIDFKYVEFNQYENFDNTIFIYKMDDFKEFLTSIKKEMHNRYLMFTNGIKNISDYNTINETKLPYIIICIDELSFISSQKDKAEIWQNLIELIQMGRASGIIIISATQCPDHKQIDTSFRRQVDSKIIGRLRQQSDLKICGVNTSEDVTNLQIGDFILDAIGFGIGNTRIKSLFLQGLTPSLTLENNMSNITKNQAISDFDSFKNDKNTKKLTKSLTKSTDFAKLVKDYFLTFESGSLVPSFRQARNIIEGLNEREYKNIKKQLYKSNIIYKTTPTATKYKIRS